MKSYKCKNCGLVCWTTVNKCKRCNALNPYLGQAHNDFNNAPASNSLVVSNTVVARNLSSSANQNLNQKFSDAIGLALHTVIPHDEHLSELEMAERNVRLAWKAGRIGVSISVGFFLQYFLENLSNESTYQFLLLPLLAIPFFGISIGLVYGMSRKSRVCATIIFCSAILSALVGLVNFLSTQELRDFCSLIFSVLLCYFYALGFLGTFKYHNLAKP